MQQHASRSASVALYVCVGYVQEVSSALQQLLSCVARSSQSSHAVAQQAIVGLTRMAGQHTLVPYCNILKPILRLALQRTGSITCVLVLFCPVFTNKVTLAITSYLCHSLHELSTISSSSPRHHGSRSVRTTVLRCHCSIHVLFNRCTPSSFCSKTSKQLCAVPAGAVQLQASHKQHCLHVCSCRPH